MFREGTDPIHVPIAEARVVVGLGNGFEAAGSILDHRLRIAGGLYGFHGGGFGELAALVRVVGPSSNSLWLRGGYMVQAFDTGCQRTDGADAYDVSLAYRKRWAGGSLFATETGVEMLSREDGGFGCNDSGVSGQSAGLRVSVAGQYAITRWLGIYARAGVRTADHMLEIHMLPELWGGIAFEL